MNKLKQNAKSIFFGICLIVFIYLLSSVDKTILENTARQLGWLGPIFIGIILICTQVFAPLSGSAFYFVGIRLYGYEEILLLFYITSIISAVITFYIARKWGRNIVIKLVGKKTMVEIDEIALVHEKPLLIVGRTLGYYFFDFISYALGLTKISFKRYITYTIFLTLIPSFILYFVFKNLNFDSFQNSMVYYISIVSTGIIFAFFFRRLTKKSRLKN